MYACIYTYAHIHIYIYIYTRIDQLTAPDKKVRVGLKSKRYMQRTQEVMMEKEDAKPFKMLSAYFTTTATTRPPTA